MDDLRFYNINSTLTVLPCPPFVSSETNAKTTCEHFFEDFTSDEKVSDRIDELAIRWNPGEENVGTESFDADEIVKIVFNSQL